MDIRELTATDEAALGELLRRIPDEDRGFRKEDLGDPATARRWLDDTRGIRLVAVDEDGTLAALAAAWPGLGRSAPLGEVRLVVAPEHRRHGLGQDLARRVLVGGLKRGMAKLTVEVAEQQGTIDMFLRIGFEPAALLCDHLRDADGALHDLVLLAHRADDAAAAVALARPEAGAT
jgi:GNAT superfamily N-acetyltransferase